MAKKENQSRPFTTDYFGRCCMPMCHREIKPGRFLCECGAHIFHVDPQPKQRQLIDMLLATGIDIPVRISYGGSRGAAKSRGLRDAALVIASEVAQYLPGIVVYIVRQVWGDCEKNHLQEWEREHLPLMDSWDGRTKDFSFPVEMGNPRIAFGYGDTFKDLRRFTRGPNIYLVLIDQAEAFTEAELDELHTPNRWPSAGPGGAKTAYFLNPGGPGSRFFKKIFFNRDFRNTNLNEKDFAFIQGYGWDNWHGWFAGENIEFEGEPLTKEIFYSLPGDLPPCPSGKYTNEWLAALPDNERFKLFVTRTSEGRKMWQKPDSIRMGELFGKFDQFAGQYFVGWDSSKVVIR